MYSSYSWALWFKVEGIKNVKMSFKLCLRYVFKEKLSYNVQMASWRAYFKGKLRRNKTVKTV